VVCSLAMCGGPSVLWCCSSVPAGTHSQFHLVFEGLGRRRVLPQRLCDSIKLTANTFCDSSCAEAGSIVVTTKKTIFEALHRPRSHLKFIFSNRQCHSDRARLDSEESTGSRGSVCRFVRSSKLSIRGEYFTGHAWMLFACRFHRYLFPRNSKVDLEL